MARLFNKFTALQVQRIARPGLYSDGNGLWLNVATGGTKSWLFRYDLHGRRREMGLGSLRDVSLAQARQRVRELREALRAGQDPLDERRREAHQRTLERAAAMTFDACAAAYIAAHRASWRSSKHTQQWENTLAMYASPLIGALPVSQVDTAMIVKLLQPIWHDKTETATRVRGRIEAILDWATVSQFRSGENPARWKGHLSNLLAKPARIAPVTNHPAMPWRQIPGFMLQLKGRTGVGTRQLSVGMAIFRRMRRV